MIVLVNEENIEKYGLVEYTGRSADELLALAEMANTAGRNYQILVPNDFKPSQGKGFNVFEEFEATDSSDDVVSHTHDYPETRRPAGVETLRVHITGENDGS